MGWLVSILGVVLAVSGAVSLVNGISYIRLDWGSTEVISGTVALAGGVVTLALGAVLFALRDLARRTERAVMAPLGVGLEALSARDETGDQDARPAPVGRFRSKLARVGLPNVERTDAPEMPAEDAPALGSPRDLDDPAPAEARPAPVVARHNGLSADAEHARDLAAAPHPGASGAAAPADLPTVVGRYDANGASYVLFSDGTIEVETETGTHRFSSMADLKEHIERQDAG